VTAKEAGAYAEFSRLAEAHPALVAAEMHCDLAELAKTTFATRTMRGNGAYELGLHAQQRLLMRELAGEAPSPALRLVAKCAVYCWTEYWTICACIAHKDTILSTPAMTRRQAAAQQRFLQALKACRMRLVKCRA
jgi:hypothetical protein